MGTILAFSVCIMAIFHLYSLGITNRSKEDRIAIVVDKNPSRINIFALHLFLFLSDMTSRFHFPI